VQRGQERRHDVLPARTHARETRERHLRNRIGDGPGRDLAEPVGDRVDAELRRAEHTADGRIVGVLPEEGEPALGHEAAARSEHVARDGAIEPRAHAVGGEPEQSEPVERRAGELAGDEAPVARIRDGEGERRHGVAESLGDLSAEAPPELELAEEDRLVEPVEAVEHERKRQHGEHGCQPRLAEQPRDEGRQGGQQRAGDDAHAEHQREDRPLCPSVEVLPQHERAAEADVADDSHHADDQDRQRDDAEVGRDEQPREQHHRREREQPRQRERDHRPGHATDRFLLHGRTPRAYQR
jgi:hypothetical protein